MSPNDAGIVSAKGSSEVSSSFTPRLLIPQELKKVYMDSFGDGCQFDNCHVFHHHVRCLSEIQEQPHLLNCKLITTGQNLHLRRIASAIYKVLICSHEAGSKGNLSSGIVDCDSNILTFQSRKSSVEDWYPLSSSRIDFPVRVISESSWEVSLSLPSQNTTYVFVVSILTNPTKGKSVIIHLVQKTIDLQILAFCLVGEESYERVQEKIISMMQREGDISLHATNRMAVVIEGNEHHGLYAMRQALLVSSPYNQFCESFL